MQVGDSIARFCVVSRATSLFFLSVPFVSVLPPPAGSVFPFLFFRLSRALARLRASFCFPRASFSLVLFFLLLVPFPLSFPRPVSFSFRVASPSPFVPFRPVSVPLGPRRVRICKRPCLRVSNELVRRVCRDVVCFSFPFPRSFFRFRSPSRVRLGIPRVSPGAVRGAPRAPFVETVVPLSIGYRPPGIDFRPFSTAAYVAPPLSCTSPAIRLQTTYSDSSPALLDSVREVSPIE